MPAYFGDSLTSPRSPVVRNWNVDLEHAVDCGQMTGHSDVTRAPKNAPMKNEDAAWCKRIRPTRYRLAADSHGGGITVVCKAAPMAYAIVICFASCIGSSRVLELSTIRKSAPFPARRSCPHEGAQPLSARLQGSLRLLPFPLPASPSVPSCDGLSPCEERYGLTLFR